MYHLYFLCAILFGCSVSPSNTLPTADDVASHQTSSNNLTATTELSPMESGDLFEGDLDISKELIDMYYSKEGEETQDRARRAARRHRDSLWRDGIVHYTFHDRVDSRSQQRIEFAIQLWERVTCLRFQSRTYQRDYLEFMADDDDPRCYSNAIGRRGGRQVIQLGPKCMRNRIILHEIGHAIGLWHEQSRPDRDKYIEIVKENIEEGKENQFRIRNAFEVDYQGTTYDYASIMHYSQRTFTRNGLNTIVVTNTKVYNSQGKPRIGFRQLPSASDTLQISRLYNCPGSGVNGSLKVYIRNGQNLPSYDLYVSVTAVDDSRGSITRNTTVKSGSGSPVWNQWLEFGEKQWQYIEVSVWDRDLRSSDDRMTDTQHFSVSLGQHGNILHCDDEECSRKMYFDYELLNNTDKGGAVEDETIISECTPNYCQNGGTCNTGSSSSSCVCSRGYSGSQCQYRHGRLRIYARYGRRLPDRDSRGDSDPYLQVVAYRYDRTSLSKVTSTRRGDESPAWNQWLDFGVGNWERFTVQVWDDDSSSNDDVLSDRHTYHTRHGNSKFVRMYTHGRGYVYFDLYFEN